MPCMTIRHPALHWTVVLPAVALVALVLSWGATLGGAVVTVLAVLLAGAVLAAVHHAEVVAHRLGEPFGSLVLAVAVTIIEVGLILTLMLAGGEGSDTLARDTVFAAVMITCNGIVGIALLAAGLRVGVPKFNAEGSGAALASVCTLAVLTLVLPTFTTTEPGPEYSPAQLGFAGVCSLLLWLSFVFTQTVRHRDFFLPVRDDGSVMADDERSADDGQVQLPSPRATVASVGMLVVCLVAVVGLAKVESPAIEVAVTGAGLPPSFVGVIIAVLVLAPETLAATRNALRDRVQTALNLAYGSAMASIGLTVPVLALSTIWMPNELTLGLGPTHLVLLALTAVISVLTVAGGHSTRLSGVLHLVVMAAFVFLSAVP